MSQIKIFENENLSKLENEVNDFLVTIEKNDNEVEQVEYKNYVDVDDNILYHTILVLWK